MWIYIPPTWSVIIPFDFLWLRHVHSFPPRTPIFKLQWSLSLYNIFDLNFFLLH